MIGCGTDKANAVYIVEDDDQLRHWLGHGLIARGFRARSFASLLDFRKALTSLGPGCVLADLRIPGGGAIELLEQLSTQWMRFPVIVMTAYSDVPSVISSMKRGAFDFIEKPFTEDDVVKHIHSVLKRLDSSFNNPAQIIGQAEIASRRIKTLTDREREVMEQLVSGHSNKAIARLLSLSTRTVEVYRANVLRKMQVRNLAQLASMSLAASVTASAEE